MWWFVAGAVLFNVAIAFAVFAFRAHRRRRVMTDTATVSARDLAALRAGSAGTTAAGSFRHPCEVKGLAQPGRAGLLKSDLSRTECVWHGHVVLRRYRSTSRDSSGRTSTSTDEERVAGHISDAPFAVADQTGWVLIRPEGLEAEETDEVLDSYVPKEHGPRRVRHRRLQHRGAGRSAGQHARLPIHRVGHPAGPLRVRARRSGR